MRLARILFAYLVFCSAAFAQVGQIPGWPPVQPAAAGSPPTLSFVASGGFTTGGGTTTISTAGANIGNPSYIATRRVFVAIFAAASTGGNVTAATINGISATVHLSYNGIAYVSAVVTSGTTGITIAVTWSSAQFQTGAWATYNVDDSLLSSSTPTGTGTGTASGVTTVSTSAVSTSAGGFILAAATINPASTALAITGLTTDGFGGANSGIFSSLGSLAGGNLTPTATWGSSSNPFIASAAWR